LTEHCYSIAYGDIKTELIFNVERNHYQMVHVSWHQGQRTYGCSMHLDLMDGKIWIQQNNTEIDIAQELIKLGVASADIVIGFHPPALRKYTAFSSG